MTSSRRHKGGTVTAQADDRHSGTVTKILQFDLQRLQTSSRIRRTKSARRVRSADVLGRTRSRTARFAVAAAVLTLTAASAALAAPGSADHTRTSSAQLSSRAHQALLSLYALDSQLHAWQTRVASLESAAAALKRHRIALRHELGSARSSLKSGQHQLGLELRALYERGNVDPVAVMLGAASLTNGLRQLEALSRVADQSKQIVAVTTAARTRLLGSQARLLAAERRLARSLAAAQAGEQKLAAAAAARLAYVSSLRSRERLRATQVRTVEATASAAQKKSQSLQGPAPAPPPPSGKRQLVVSATCYDLPGKTATGMPVGRGVVAVDPSVIPLGSRLYIPGYGNGVAADVGSGIQGNTIDLWYPTYAECAAWGRRTVTIAVF
jgi:3D (Asp-Asp-Asp) domain-containing protein/peptidoglycan hydrolase CwlO-like protein